MDKQVQRTDHFLLIYKVNVISINILIDTWNITETVLKRPSPLWTYSLH